MRALLATVLFAVTVTPAVADEVTGEVLAFDRKAGIIVLKNKEVFSLDLIAEQPEDLHAGDRIRVVYEAEGEDGITKIDSITKL